MKLSYVIVTRNRRERLLATLERLRQETPLPSESWEAIVVDNGSDDGTPSAVRKAFPAVRLIALPENEGMPARNHAIKVAQGRYIVFLDDDSYPTRGALPAAMTHLSRRPKTAAIVARVVLPSGGFEAPAFPAVTLGGASIVRRSVLEEVGGFAPEFFRQAEEYDMSFRIWQAGYRIERFEDLLFRHDKDAGGRSSALAHRMDVRNNLILAERYLPRPLRAAYRSDWARRYVALARHAGHAGAAALGLREARVWARREAAVGRRTLDAATIERLFEFDRQARAVAAWKKEHAIKRIVLADYSKNIYATWSACRLAGLEIAAVADPRPAFARHEYRGLPILDEKSALTPRPDGVVLSNINPAQVDEKLSQLRSQFAGPILRLWEPRYLLDATGPVASAA